jgi:hypothetical protein
LPAVLLGGAGARAQPPPAAAGPAAEPAAAEATPPSTGSEGPVRAARPATAAQALDQAAAAYQFGDLHLMVDLARMVVEGAVPGSEDQRVQALQLFGIGLYLSGRPDGAERAFADLLHLRPRATLDPSVTRPEVVAFFHDVRRRNRPQKTRALAFLPPLGQFQNDTPKRGWLFLGLEALTLGAGITTYVMFENKLRPASEGSTCRAENDDTRPCERLRTAALVSFGAFAASYAIGVADALINFDDGDPEDGPRLSLLLLPRAAALRVTF